MKRLLFASVVIVAGCSDGSSGLAEPVVDPGRMRVQISGAVQHRSDWQSYGEFRDLLAGDANEVSRWFL